MGKKRQVDSAFKAAKEKLNQIIQDVKSADPGRTKELKSNHKKNYKELYGINDVTFTEVEKKSIDELIKTIGTELNKKLRNLETQSPVQPVSPNFDEQLPLETAQKLKVAPLVEIERQLRALQEKKDYFASKTSDWHTSVCESKDEYRQAFAAAQYFECRIQSLYDDYLENGQLESFKNEVSNLLKTPDSEAKSHLDALDTPRGFKVKTILANIVFSLCTLVVPALMVYGFRAAYYGLDHTFFKPQTDGMSKLKAVEATVDSLSSPAC